MFSILKKILGIAIVILVSSCSTAPTSTAEKTVEINKAPSKTFNIKKPFLYTVKKNGEIKAYLFGTIHLGFKMADFPKDFWIPFDEAPTLFKEATNAETVNNEKSLKELGESKILRKSDKEPRLKTLLDPEVYKKLEKFFSEEYSEHPGALDKLTQHPRCFDKMVLIDQRQATKRVAPNFRKITVHELSEFRQVIFYCQEGGVNSTKQKHSAHIAEESKSLFSFTSSHFWAIDACKQPNKWVKRAAQSDHV